MSFLTRELIKGQRVILASQSPRRKELLSMITDDFDVIPSECEEVVPDGMAAEDIPLCLAEQKCRDVVNKCNGNALVIGSDTVVILDDIVLGKPKDKDDAFEMLRALSGRAHTVVSGLCTYYKGSYHISSGKAIVKFKPCTNEELWTYIATGEPFDKAGAYGIQGLGGLLVDSIQGDYYSIVGLPVKKLAEEIYDILR